MATYWTLTNGAGVERVLADWGIGPDVVLELENLAMGVLSVPVPGAAVTDNVLWAFEERVTLRRGRVLTDGVFSGGVIEFQGTRLLHVLDGKPGFEGVVYRFGDPWYHVQSCPYQQTVYWYNGNPLALASTLVSSVTLLYKVTGAGTAVARNTGEQITDCLQHVLDQYSLQGLAAPYQIGTIEPAVALPTYQAQDLKCSEAIEYCLRCSPDARVYFDHSTVPPTVHVRKRASCTGVTVALGDGATQEAVRLVPRYDLQARAVVLYFKATHAVDAESWVEVTKQKYGPHGANSVLDPDGGLRVVLQTIELSGYSVTRVTGKIVAAGVSNTAEWWKGNVPEVNHARVQNISFVAGSLTVKDDAGVDVSLSTYPNKLVDGAVAPWMKLSGGAAVVAKQVTITVLANWDEMSEPGTGGYVFAQVKNKLLSARVTITNGVTDTYSAVASSVDAEAVPTGVAQAIYEGLAVLQYDGAVTLVEEECGGGITLGNVLHLSGGRSEWATMGAQINGIRKEFGTGRTTLTLGPARLLSAGDLTRLFLINRGRRNYNDPMTMASASAPGKQVSLGANAAKENTAGALEQHSLLTVAAVPSGTTNTCIVRASGSDRALTIKEVVGAAGTDATGRPQATMALSDLPASDVRAKFRYLKWRDPEHACAEYAAYVLMTEPVATGG